VATGGLSYPELGATDIGYRIARRFDLKVTPLRPALVPFTFNPEDPKIFQELSGLSTDAEVSCHGKNFRGDILFTHRGLSGPAILQISSYWTKGDDIHINLLPDMNAYELLMTKQRSKIEMKNLLSQYLPKRFAGKWCKSYIQSKPINHYTDKELRNIAHLVHKWTIKPAGTEGYKRAEVTLGGVDTEELSSKTMEARRVPGLYFIGEVMDVTGELGGYNLHWAWASGYVAGQYV
ncbi:MAG: aminoacetone oxidase family FAD-binding enzyme, partial [Nitrospirae bacterium]|nr:aminoacetone oxidase family FAD-binding enzyme [Nitrospirota bacterium]